MFAFFRARAKLQEEKDKLEQNMRELAEQALMYQRLAARYSVAYAELETEVKVLRRRAKSAPPAAQFDDKEIRILIGLCHPDKHNNDLRALEMTKKLILMRK